MQGAMCVLNETGWSDHEHCFPPQGESLDWSGAV